MEYNMLCLWTEVWVFCNQRGVNWFNHKWLCLLLFFPCCSANRKRMHNFVNSPIQRLGYTSTIRICHLFDLSEWLCSYAVPTGWIIYAREEDTVSEFVPDFNAQKFHCMDARAFRFCHEQLTSECKLSLFSMWWLQFRSGLQHKGNAFGQKGSIVVWWDFSLQKGELFFHVFLGITV